MPKSASEIRQQFLDFFRERGHTIVPSAPVVPSDDPTLLFTNAGMNQFKPYFLGIQKPANRRVADTQKCIRVSGKHNDLEEVGLSPYHHTFFEMLGNWSFGDYFKKESLRWGWELLTVGFGLPKDKLYATVYETDDEAEQIWKNETDINPAHVLRFGKKDNWWSMGDTGPCGPCSEIHIDRGPDIDSDPKSFVNSGSPRYIELWNHVFIQFDSKADGSLIQLPEKHVDTGAGLERLTTVIGGHRSNYDTDLFQPIIQAVAESSGVPYSNDTSGMPHRVIADHLRCLTFAIGDGAIPGNEGRGYVLRRILRRAARFGRKLEIHEPFIYKFVPVLVDIMGKQFPEIKDRHVHIARVIEAEEVSFGKTLDRGLERFDEVVAVVRKNNSTVIPGEEVFKLYDSFGFPLDLMQLMARENNLTVDEVGFEKAMEGQKQRARAKSSDSHANIQENFLSLQKIHDSLNSGDFAKINLGFFNARMQLDPIWLTAFKSTYTLSGMPDNSASTDVLRALNTVSSNLNDLYGATFKIGNDVSESLKLFAGLTPNFGAVAAIGQLAHIDNASFLTESLVKTFDSIRKDLETGQNKSDAGSLLFSKKIAIEKAKDAITDIVHVRQAFKNFVGYDELSIDSIVKFVDFDETESVFLLSSIQTPFYVASGGQVQDIGHIELNLDDGSNCEFKVLDIIRQDSFNIHRVKPIDYQYVPRLKTFTQENLSFSAKLVVDPAHRIPTQYNHTATHLLHAALRNALGEHVHQAGSYVGPDYLRFDYTHFEKPSPEELHRIESQVNDWIRDNYIVTPINTTLKEAQAKGAMALFGEKYGDDVRMIVIGEEPDPISRELCGGCHVKRTGDIGVFVIRAETSAAAGVRRIDALTGDVALKYLLDKRQKVDDFVEELGSEGSDPLEKLHKVLDEKKKLSKELEQLRGKAAAGEMSDLASKAVQAGSVKLVASRVKADNMDQLKEMGDALRDNLKSGVGVLVSLFDGKPAMVVVVTPDLVTKGVDAVPIVKELGKRLNGGGGGKPHLATAGGKNPDGMDQAVADAKSVVEKFVP